jgi:hypothetical protein
MEDTATASGISLPVIAWYLYSWTICTCQMHPQIFMNYATGGTFWGVFAWPEVEKGRDGEV